MITPSSTGLMFVLFPPSCDSKKAENSSQTSVDEGEDKEGDEGGTSTIQERYVCYYNVSKLMDTTIMQRATPRPVHSMFYHPPSLDQHFICHFLGANLCTFVHTRF